MLSSLDMARLAGGGLGKQRPSIMMKWLANPRRLFGQLMCRLPLLALWTLVVLLILYKSLSYQTQTLEEVNVIDDISRPIGGLYNKQQQQDDQLLFRRSSPNDNDYPNVITRSPPPTSSFEGKKSPLPEFVRQSKVFILIVQNEEEFRLSKRHPQVASSSSSPKKAQSIFEHEHLLNIPHHIRFLIGILEAHRIDYAIGSTSTGLPTSLLADQDQPRENVQFSVIVIDDFIKYTKLNRWMRDQLDRHCRLNQIGIITYLTAKGDESSSLHRRHLLPRTRANLQATIGATTTTEGSLADQFPMSFKTMGRSVDDKLCDYQLNEQSSILRILKRRPNFIIKGSLASNLNQAPWTVMSSNHVTYEPLTWARHCRYEKQWLQASGDEVSGNLDNENEAADVTAASTGTHKRDRNMHDDPLQIQSIDQRQQLRRRQGSQSSGNWTLGEHVTGSLSPPPPPSMSKSLDQANSDFRPSPPPPQILSMLDLGLYDGIKRVIFGGANHHWLNRVLLLDAIEHLSSGRIIGPLDRYIQIDIDDIFVGESGKRMNRSDVEFLIDTQRQFARRIEGGFKFTLGYSGKYFKHGTREEDEGDEELIRRAYEFDWFCHFWSHSKAHLFNTTESLAAELKRNMEFARHHRLPIIGRPKWAQADKNQALSPTYAVAPHHSGVYPVHEQLYEVWRHLLNVQVTSTEEYPALRPASSRRAFVHQAIKVLPRQTCGLYTHTIFRHKYPGGIGKLEATIRGGELFETLLHNPVNIYMSHMSNYANDRLAPYTFAALLDFVQTNTNLQLMFASSSENQLGPGKLANYYFHLFPRELGPPLWSNPCQDKRHLAIWAPFKHNLCHLAPKLLIVGPQKTGTTALYTFLKLNPLFKSSQQSSEDFEEIQFFNDKHYANGVDWYLSRFLPKGVSLNSNLNEGEVSNWTESIYFDKSATYFDDPKAPERASRLVPDARIVILLVDPADRAYSWYQHIRAHGDLTANTLSFEQVIVANEEELGRNQALKSLRNRCLHPGYYSQHLSRWLEFYKSRQIIIIDGLWFRHNPVSVMKRLQLLLKIKQPIDYNQLLVRDDDKGFYCERDQFNGRSKCLGKSKGRKYEPMSREARIYLNRHYWAYNRDLARILSDIGQPLPTWLDEAVSVGSVIY